MRFTQPSDRCKGNISEDAVPQRSCEFYQKYNIELRCGLAVTQVNPKLKTITFEDQSKLSYDKLLVATGGKAIKLDVPGADLENIYTLHQFTDAANILAETEQVKQVVVVGSIALRETGIGNREQGTAGCEGISGFRNVLT